MHTPSTLSLAWDALKFEEFFKGLGLGVGLFVRNQYYLEHVVLIVWGTWVSSLQLSWLPRGSQRLELEILLQHPQGSLRPTTNQTKGKIQTFAKVKKINPLPLYFFLSKHWGLRPNSFSDCLVCAFEIGGDSFLLVVGPSKLFGVEGLLQNPMLVALLPW